MYFLKQIAAALGSLALAIAPAYAASGQYPDPTFAPKGPNLFLAGPTSGSAASPTYRKIAPADVATLYGTVNYASSFDVVCDGTTDNNPSGTGPLQNWASAVTNDSYNVLPPGICLFSTPITFPTSTHVAVVGDGTQITYIGGSTTVNLLTVGVSGLGGNCSVRGWSWSGIRLESITAMSSASWAMKVNDACESYFNVDLGGQLQSGSHNLFEGIWFNGGNRIQTFVNTYVQGVGFQVNGDSTSVQATDIYLNGKIVGGLTGVNVAGNVGGMTFESADILSNAVEIRISQDVIAHANSQIFFGPSMAIDQTVGGAGYGIDVADAGSANSYLFFTGTWVASAGNTCIYLESGTSWTVNYDGGAILNCGASAIFTASASNNINMVGTNISRNATYGINNGGGSAVTKCGIQFASNGTANTIGTVGSSC